MAHIGGLGSITEVIVSFLANWPVCYCNSPDVGGARQSCRCATSIA